MKKYVKIILIVIVILIILATVFVICMSNPKIATKINDFIASLGHYETEIICSFESEADILNFEKGLQALNVEVVSIKENGQQHSFFAESHYLLYAETLHHLKKTYEVEIVDSEGNTVLTPYDVWNEKFDGVLLRFSVPDSLFDAYDYDEIINMRLKIDGVVYDNTYAGFLELDEGNSMDFITKADSSSSVLIKAVLGLSSYTVEGDITIENIINQ